MLSIDEIAASLAAAKRPGPARAAIHALRDAAIADAASHEALVAATAAIVAADGGPLDSWWPGADPFRSTMEDRELTKLKIDRSDLAILRALYAGSAAEEQLASCDTFLVDEMLRALGDGEGTRPPAWVPHDHWWWWDFVVPVEAAIDPRLAEVVAAAASEADDAPFAVAYRLRRLWEVSRTDLSAMTRSVAALVEPSTLDGWWSRAALLLDDEDDGLERFLARVARTNLELMRELGLGAAMDTAAADVKLRAAISRRVGNPPIWLPDVALDAHWWWGRASTAPRSAPAPAPQQTPRVGAIVRSPEETTWIAIHGGAFDLGLHADEVDRLASASAKAARDRFVRDGDPLHLDREAAELAEHTGNPDYLRALLAAALPWSRVVLDGYEIAQAPVTNAEWKRFLASSKLAPPEGWALPGGDAPDRAVIGVSWDEASAFAAWAGAALPTEAQWERAARGPQRRLFPWGDAWGVQGAWIDAQDHPHPWRSDEHLELASPDGVVDLVTRRWEWCADDFALPERARLDALTTLYPGLRPDGKVRRGGQGAGPLVACTVARTGTRPSWRADGTGFHLVRRR